MEHHHCIQASEPVQSPQGPQPPKSGYGFLAAVLDDGPLVDRLSQYRRIGRQGYHPKVMLRVLLAKYVLKIRFNNQLLERLRGSRKLREVCGLDDHVPSESSLSRFFSRLADHQDLFEECLTKLTNEVRELVPTVKRRPQRQDQPLPPLGAVLAIDSTLFETYANPKRPVMSDPDVRWGVKHSSRAKDGDTEWGFGYKLHMVSDATHGVPLVFTVTPANASDFPELPVVTRKALDKYPWMKPGAFLADRGYDGQTNHEFLISQEIIPVIHMRKPTADDKLYDGIYNAEGKPICIGEVPMDPETGHHLFRCPTEGCPLKSSGTKAITHCDTETWEDPQANPRVLGPLPRFSRAWKRLYRHRMSIERIFRSLKHSRGLEGHCVRGMKKIKLHATLSVLTYQATILARLRANDMDRMRRMTVPVA